MANITDLITKFVNSNTASTSGSGSLPSNTIANPKGDVKAITTRSGVSYNGPQISSPPKEKENEPEVTKDTVQPSTENIQPPVVQTNDQIGEPVVASKTKPTLPYPSRANKEKFREKDNLLASKFMEIFRNLHFELSFADALLHMPKFAPMFRKLLNDKDKMIELTKTPLETFYFHADFVALITCRSSGSLILGRPFLRTARALIDVHGEQMTLRHDDQSVTFKVGDTKTFSYNIIDSLRVDVIRLACEEYVQEVVDGIYDSEGDTVYLEELLSVINSDPNLSPSPVCEINIPIDPLDQEKTTFTCPYGTFAYRRMPFGLCNAPGTFQRCMVAIFHDMIEKTMEVFMDDFSVFGDSFSSCLSHLDKMLQRCEDTNLVLNWEKCHFMVKEGIVLGHKISKSGIEVDKSKVDVIAKLPHPTTVKGIRSFLGHAGFYRRFI
ncbi:reverse transcriptase domain-containing protein [Tanacetum coccineum]|uniref:Reverse transcriptase domain-containing protein n=1 Tax=Tanacetum coccineum TaxID=301880 RepID=A0ABQ5HH66_9ASTR